MAQSLRVGVVPGVSPDRWVSVWRERMAEVDLVVVRVDDADAAAALDGTVDLLVARIPVPGVDAADVHVIPLWDETPVAVAARTHPIKLFDTVTEADLAAEDVYPGWDAATLDIVAAGHGIARMPQAVLRAAGRRDLVGRPITDAEPTRIGLVWRRSTEGDEVQEFVGVVRGRTAASSRGTARTPTPTPTPTPTVRPVRPTRPARRTSPVRGRRGRRR